MSSEQKITYKSQLISNDIGKIDIVGLTTSFKTANQQRPA